MADDFSIQRIHELPTGSYSNDAYVAIDRNDFGGLKKLPLSQLAGQPGEDGFSPVVEMTEVPATGSSPKGLLIRVTDKDHEYGQTIEITDEIIDVIRQDLQYALQYRLGIRPNSIGRSKLKNPVMLVPDAKYIKFIPFEDSRGKFAVVTLNDSLKQFVNDLGYGSYIGGRVYKTVTVGGKTWMAENLDFKFNGLVVGQSGMSSTELRANYYDNDENTYGVDGNKYGLLYNWSAVKYLNDNRSTLIPGWHVPSAAEWDALATAVGGSSVAGTKLKSTTSWSSGNGDGSYLFNVYPAGRYSSFFNNVGSYTYLWTSTEYSTTSAYSRNFSTGTSMDSSISSKDYGYSVRLVKD